MSNRRQNPIPIPKDVLQELQVLRREMALLKEEKSHLKTNYKLVCKALESLQRENIHLKTEVKDSAIPTDVKTLRKQLKALQDQTDMTKMKSLEGVGENDNYVQLKEKLQVCQSENASLRKANQELLFQIQVQSRKIQEQHQEILDSQVEHLSTKQENLDMFWGREHLQLENCELKRKLRDFEIKICEEPLDALTKIEDYMTNMEQEIQTLQDMQNAVRGTTGTKQGRDEIYRVLKNSYLLCNEENHYLKQRNLNMVYKIQDLISEISDLKNKVEVGSQQESAVINLKEKLTEQERKNKALEDSNQQKHLKVKVMQTVSVQTECKDPERTDDEKEEETRADGWKNHLQEIQQELSEQNDKSGEEEKEGKEKVKLKKEKKLKKSSFAKFCRRLFHIRK